MSEMNTRTLFGGLVKVKKINWKYLTPPREFTDKEIESIVSCKVIQGKWTRACMFTLKTDDVFCITVDSQDLQKYPEVFALDAEVDVRNLRFGVLTYVGEPNPDLKATQSPRVLYVPAEENGMKEVTNFDNPFGVN